MICICQTYVSFFVGGGLCSWQLHLEISHKCPQILLLKKVLTLTSSAKRSVQHSPTCVGAMSQKICLGAPHGVNNSQDWRCAEVKNVRILECLKSSKRFLAQNCFELWFLGIPKKISEQDLKENMHSNVSTLEAISWVIPKFMTLNQEGVPEQVALSMINGCMELW